MVDAKLAHLHPIVCNAASACLMAPMGESECTNPSLLNAQHPLCMWATASGVVMQDVEFEFGQECILQGSPQSTFGKITLSLAVMFLNSALDATGKSSQHEQGDTDSNA